MASDIATGTQAVPEKKARDKPVVKIPRIRDNKKHKIM